MSTQLKLVLLLAVLVISVFANQPVDKGCDGNDRCGPQRCKPWGCLKRAARQDDMGPFWANRGKKDPRFFESKLYAEEPHWILVRGDNESPVNYDPFFTTRGKKDAAADAAIRSGTASARGNGGETTRERRDPQMVLLDASPFLAARGKRPSKK